MSKPNKRMTKIKDYYRSTQQIADFRRENVTKATKLRQKNPPVRSECNGTTEGRSEKASLSRLIARFVIKHGTAAERPGDGLLTRDDRVEIGFGRRLCFDRSRELLKAAKTFQLFSVSNLRRVKRSTKKMQRFVVGF